MDETVSRASHREAEEYLSRYLAADGTDYAVMIDGPWGSGKTYFLKSFLDRRNASVLNWDPLSASGRYWYASLAGVSNVNQIYEQFFASEHGKSGRIATEIALRASAYFSKNTVGTPEDAAKIRRAMLDPRERVLVFDDLERSSMPVLEALALVYSFAKDGVKVIVVANEEEITSPVRNTDKTIEEAEPARSDYERQKEKFVSKTIRVGSDAEEVLPLFTARMTSPIAKACVERSTETVLGVFRASKMQNLRSLRQAIEDFDHLVGMLEATLREHPKAVDAILVYLIAVEMEFRGGTKGMSVEGIRALRSERWSSLLGKGPSGTGVRLLASYPMVSWKDPIIPHEHMATLLKAGTIAIEELINRVQSHPAVAPPQSLAPWRALWDWTSLTRAQYVQFRDLLAGQLANRSILHPGELLHAIGEVLRLRKFGDDLINGADPDAYFRQYVDEVVADRRLQPLTELFGFSSGSHAGLVYPENDTPEFQALRDLVRGGVGRVRDAKLADILPAFLADLRVDQRAALRLNNYGEKEGNLQGVPFLQLCNPKEFAELLVDGSAPRETVMAAFLDRYSNDVHEKSLAAEHPWVEDVEREFAVLVDREAPPYKRLLEYRQSWMKSELDKSLRRTGTPAIPPST
ncbi:P-loop NTPase fold protein [Mesorhizobium sp. ES1-3]|uniref:P-loop NTPase fold protein n=1 Tax=Mesorhizobium sp. ES1-3 TaxID=2876628 RepID=UPI001CC9E9CA|nr:P-loop NTPase fold protein [Mesorhizobium sp. ES1-3]MBZ9673909.1 KAP family NTPase [Mesorhizobium sp. ES1-3]